MTAQLINPVSIVRECKGAALSILWLMLAIRKPVTQEWLERHTGYTDKPVSQAITYLEETGRIVRARSGWCIAEGFQLELPLELEEDCSTGEPACSPSPVSESSAPGDLYPHPQDNNSAPSCPSRNNSDSININDLDLNLNQDLKDQELILISGVGNSPTPQDQKESEAELGRIGIAINNRTRPLLALSPPEIRAGHNKAAAFGYGKETGYIVKVLLGMLATKQHGKDWVHDPSRYAEWEED